MSTPKLNVRNSSVTIKRDFSGQRIASRERLPRDSEDPIMKKRFKIQPYSSFEDRFIEQDKLNHYIFEQFNKIESKLSLIKPILDHEDPFRDIHILQNRVQTIFSEFEYFKLTSKEFLDFKAAITRKIGNVDEFKGKSNEKDKVLFEEVVRLGQVVENCEHSIENLKTKSVNPGKVQVLIQNVEDFEEKFRSMEAFYLNLKTLIDKESTKVQKISQSNSILAKEIENYMSQLSHLVTKDLVNTSEEMHKRVLDEQETRQKNTIDLKHLIEISAAQLSDKFFTEIGNLKSQIQNLDSLIYKQNSHIETLKNEFLIAAKNEKHEILALVSGLESNLRELNEKYFEAFRELKISQENEHKNFTSTIFAEIQTRVQAEHELQNMIKITTKGIFQEIHELQISFNEFKEQGAAIQSEIRSSVSEKCDLLSRFVESEVKKIRSVIKNNIQKYKSAVPRDIDLKVTQAREDFANCLKALREELSSNIKQTQDYTTKSISDTRESLDSILKKLYTDLDKSSQSVQSSLIQLDEKIIKIDENSYKDLTEITEYLNDLDESLKELRQDNAAYEEIIARLETQIEVKVTNEKLSREHAIGFFHQTLSDRIENFTGKMKKFTENLKQYAKNSEVIDKIQELSGHYIEVSKAFEMFRENIKAEMNDFIVEAGQLKEKVEVSEVIVDEMKAKLNEISENYLRFGLMLKNTMKEYDKERRANESKNVLNDLTSRVETMGILSKLDEILVEMDANEKETQAMLMLYKKELTYVQEKQKKGLEDAQNAVKGIFDMKIAGLQQMVSSEMDRILEYIEENKVIVPNMSSLHEYASKVKIIPPGYKPH